MKTFRSYTLAVQFYKACLTLQVPSHVRNQLLRAALSIPLNLREGYGRTTLADQQRFFTISFGSVREIRNIRKPIIPQSVNSQPDIKIDPNFVSFSRNIN